VTKHRFQPWSEHVKEKIAGNDTPTECQWAEIVNAMKNPDLEDFLLHHLQQFERARQEAQELADNAKWKRKGLISPFLSDDDGWKNFIDDRWMGLHKSTLSAIGNFNGISADAALAFYKMGQWAIAIGRPTAEEMMELLRGKLSEAKRNAPLHKRNINKKIAKSRAEAIARDLWSKDTDQCIRLTAMCEEVWSRAIDEGLQPLLPDNAAGLRIWLRKVAKDCAPWASVGGAPKRKNLKRTSI